MPKTAKTTTDKKTKTSSSQSLAPDSSTKSNLFQMIFKVLSSIGRWVKAHWKLVTVLLIVISGFGGWRYRQAEANKPVLNFEHPQYRDLTKVVEVSGVIDAAQKASLRFAAGGKVVYLSAQEGDHVAKWQTIATIDQRELQKRLEKDLNLYMKERWDREEIVDDQNTRAFPENELRDADQEQWDLENTVLDVEIRDIAISDTYLTAPFDGVLVDSPTDVTGVTLLATDTFDLVNPDTLVFKAAVDEADVALVQKGQTGQIFLDAYPEEPVSSQVSYIAYTSSESSTGTVFVVEFPITGVDALSRYRLGMNGDVEIKVAEKQNVLSVPFIATRERDGRFYVDIKTDDESYQERLIETGLETEDYVEVLSGISATDQILVPED